MGVMGESLKASTCEHVIAIFCTECYCQVLRCEGTLLDDFAYTFVFKNYLSYFF